MLEEKRIRVIIGHYGSGKTEFAVNYAMKLAAANKKTAIIDLDIVNPYFRSREKEEMFIEKGIEITSSILGNKGRIDMPALDPANLKPLQNKEYDVIIDVGDGVINYIPTREQLDAQIAKEAKPDVQNLTHGNKCGSCQKFQRQTPNPKSKMALCTFNGVMVLEHSTSCEKYRKSNAPESAWK